MAVFFKEMMLGDEDVVVTELIGELDLLQRLVVYLELVMLVPLVGVERFGRLQLEINAEFHDLIHSLKGTSVRGTKVAWRWTCATYTCNWVGCQPEDETRSRATLPPRHRAYTIFQATAPCLRPGVALGPREPCPTVRKKSRWPPS